MRTSIPSAGDGPDRPYSMVIKSSGNYVFVSGQGPLDLATYEIHRGSLEEQTRLTFENLKTHLEASGASLADVVNCRVYLAELNPETFAEMNKVYMEYFPTDRPTRTTIGCQLLGIDVEIDCVACVD
jgi:2-iminobutanoate/2-iminopropanoate deaminase